MTPPSITTASPDEWDIWRDLRLAALADAPDAFESTLAATRTRTEADWRALLTSGSVNLLARLDTASTPVGMVSALPQPHHVDLVGMWVAPHARGRGVGDILVAHVLELARELGRSRVRLCVKPGNDHAFALYVRHGFAQVEVCGTDRMLQADL